MDQTNYTPAKAGPSFPGSEPFPENAYINSAPPSGRPTIVGKDRPSCVPLDASAVRKPSASRRMWQMPAPYSKFDVARYIMLLCFVTCACVCGEASEVERAQREKESTEGVRGTERKTNAVYAKARAAAATAI